MKLAPQIDSLLLKMEQYTDGAYKLATEKTRVEFEENSQNHSCITCIHAGVAAVPILSKGEQRWFVEVKGCGRYLPVEGLPGITREPFFCAFGQGTGDAPDELPPPGGFGAGDQSNQEVFKVREHQ